MELKTFEAGPLSANNYILTDNNESVLIDCSEYIPEIMNNFNIKYILLTHGHFDHILGINKTKEHFGAKVLMNKDDEDRLQESQMFLQNFGLPAINPPKIDSYIDENSVIEFGNTKIKCIHTPGHTQGSMSYLVDNTLFSGDTLFKNTYGRCDLPGGDFEQIKKSLTEKLFVLPDDVVVYSGHGEKTTIGYEKINNEIL